MLRVSFTFSNLKNHIRGPSLSFIITSHFIHVLQDEWNQHAFLLFEHPIWHILTTECKVATCEQPHYIKGTAHGSGDRIGPLVMNAGKKLGKEVKDRQKGLKTEVKEEGYWLKFSGAEWPLFCPFC